MKKFLDSIQNTKNVGFPPHFSHHVWKTDVGWQNKKAKSILYPIAYPPSLFFINYSSPKYLPSYITANQKNR